MRSCMSVSRPRSVFTSQQMRCGGRVVDAQEVVERQHPLDRLVAHRSVFDADDVVVATEALSNLPLPEPPDTPTVPPTAGVNETTVREIVAEMNGTVSGADVARIVSDSLAALTTSSSSSTVTRNGLLAMRAALDNLIAGT